MIAFDAAIAEADDAAAAAGEVLFVRYEEDGVTRGVYLVEEVHDFVAGAGVEGAGRLVGEDDGRLVDEGARNGHALLLAAGQLVGPVVNALGQAHGVEGAGGLLAALVRRQAAVDQRQLDIAQGIGAGQEVKGLKYKADLLIADPR